MGERDWGVSVIATGRRVCVVVAILGLLAACGQSERVGPVDTGPGPGGDIDEPLACELPLPSLSTMQAPIETPCSASDDERVVAMSNDGIGSTSALGLPAGRYALPGTESPTQLVVMFHGHLNNSCSWRDHLRAAADRGAVAVAMDYTGLEDREIDGVGTVQNYGWPVRAGAADSILAAQYFLDRYPTIIEVFNFNVSMGGNVGGYASYIEDAVRPDCSPLWDYMVSAEGVHNLTEEYIGIRTLALVNATAAIALPEIEEENGGTLEEVPEAYTEITNTAHTDALAYLKGVVLTHGATDQTVPVDQSNQMAAGLRLAGVPTRFITVVPSDHQWEGESSNQVMFQALEALFGLMDGGAVEDGDEQVAGP